MAGNDKDSFSQAFAQPDSSFRASQQASQPASFQGSDATGEFQAPPVQPHYAAPLASRDHVAAGFLALFLGLFGVHKFYLGYSAQGFILLALTVIGGLFSFGLAAGVAWIIAVIEAIVYFSKSQSEFEQTYVYGKREWF